ncbi:MAG: hypothetical protein ACRDQ0_19695, partial [Pseudonocardia sp.]
ALVALDAIGGALADPVPTVDATLELDAAAGRVLRRTWAPQAECGCGAARRVPGHGDATCAEGRTRDTI